MSRPAVSQHLRVLKDAGLVTDERATRRLYRIDAAGLVELRAYVEGLWDTALASFKEAAEADNGEGA